ncbi:hypothetical protein BH23BAC1_BH23BAC1_13700 [soil metagenome]
MSCLRLNFHIKYFQIFLFEIKGIIRISLFIFLVIFWHCGKAQVEPATEPDTTQTITGTEIITLPNTAPLIQRVHSPRRASFYSAVLPGLGQAYNRKYWKIPILYGGGGVLVYFVNFNHQRYSDLRGLLFSHLNNPGQEIIYQDRVLSENAVRRQIDMDRRNRDYLIIISGIIYFLNIADAMVDAHLINFDLGEELALKLQPTGGRTGNNVTYAGLSLTLNF